MFKDHLVLHLQILSQAGFEGSLIHGDGDRNVNVRQTDGIKIDSFVVGFSSWFGAAYQFREIRSTHHYPSVCRPCTFDLVFVSGV